MRLSVGTQLTAVTLTVLTIVTTVLVLAIAAQEREHAISNKVAAASMVSDLFAASVSAAVVFGDDDAIRSSLVNLERTEDVVGGAVYSPTAPVAIAAFGVPVHAADESVIVRQDDVVIARAIRGADGKAVGRTTIAFSLARENAGCVRSRRNLALGGVVIMLLTAALLILATRFGVVNPLLRLAEAAKELEDGQLANRPSEHGNSELATLARAFNSMSDAVAERERRLKAELQVAADLQLSVLPRTVQIDGIETSAMMKPATEVGGDYYDIIPAANGCWIGIGDVSGHGLGAGVIMLMLQSAVAALVTADPDVSPVAVECAVNRVLYENIRERMGRRDYATLSILRYSDDGHVRFAGAHEEILVYRAATGTIEKFDTPGTWVGARRDVSAVTTESSFFLEENDVMVLYTDGVTEAMRNGEQLGPARLAAAVVEHARGAADDVRDAVVATVAEWTASPADDVSVVVLKQTGAVRSQRFSGVTLNETAPQSLSNSRKPA